MADNRRSGPTPAIIAAAAVLACAVADSLVAQDDAARMMAIVEASQGADRQGPASVTLQHAIQQLRVPGLSVAVIKDFKIQWARGYGVADAESGRPVGPDTMFQAASISKPVAAMAALRLVQEGRFSLDDDVNTILKSWQVPKTKLTRDRPVTPRTLMSHTSGADDGFGFPGYHPSARRPTVLQILRGEPPSNVGPVLFARPPLQAAKYSGGAVTIMQLALADFAGKPFAAIMQSTVLGPLRMTNSTYEQPLPLSFEARAARAHDAQGRRMAAPWHVYPEQAAAGLWTTPSDLARVAIEVQRAVRGPEGAVLTQALAREMVTRVGVGTYAVGFNVQDRGDERYFAHSGSNWGYRCNLFAHVRKGLGIVVMTNGNNGSAAIEEVKRRVETAYGWDLLREPLQQR